MRCERIEPVADAGHRIIYTFLGGVGGSADEGHKFLMDQRKREPKRKVRIVLPMIIQGQCLEIVGQIFHGFLQNGNDLDQRLHLPIDNGLAIVFLALILLGIEQLKRFIGPIEVLDKLGGGLFIFLVSFVSLLPVHFLAELPEGFLLDIDAIVAIRAGQLHHLAGVEEGADALAVGTLRQISRCRWMEELGTSDLEDLLFGASPVIPPTGHGTACVIAALVAQCHAKGPGGAVHPQTRASRLPFGVVPPAAVSAFAALGAEQPQKSQGTGNAKGPRPDVLGDLRHDLPTSVRLLGAAPSDAARRLLLLLLLPVVVVDGAVLAAPLLLRSNLGHGILMDGGPDDEVGPTLDVREEVLAHAGQMENVPATGEVFEDERNDRRGELVEGDGQVAVADGAVGIGPVGVRSLQLPALLLALLDALVLVAAEEGLEVAVVVIAGGDPLPKGVAGRDGGRGGGGGGQGGLLALSLALGGAVALGRYRLLGCRRFGRRTRRRTSIGRNGLKR
mmetsp:Transcript_6795/g.18948  ORF Transcript_6795/g.18948 Transcript_6795/m.18948 type:complete len:504 (-) Transcript_6795:171-1682(-)